MIEEGGYTPIEALAIQNSAIVEFLEGLPEQKVHCSVMGAEALESSVFNWAQRRGVNLESLGVDIHAREHAEGRIVCKCFSVSEPYLRRKIKELNLRTIPEITNAVKAGGACMSCHHAPGGLQDLLDEIWGGDDASREHDSAAVSIAGDGVSEEEPELSPYQFAKRIEEALDRYVRPILHKDGGDLEIVDIRDHLVYCRLQGACASCAGATQTMKTLVERVLKGEVDKRVKVIQV
jgi:NifU-like protein